MKKLFSIVLALSITLSAVGCSGTPIGSGGGDGDGSKTTIVFAMYEGGFGTTWVDEAIKTVEAKYKDEELEPGKKGLIIDVKPDKGYSGSGVASLYGAWDCDMYYTESFSAYNEFAKRHAFLDITDVVTSKVNGEEKTIEEKMYQSYRDWFKVDGAYYALPHAYGSGGISYNVDIFEDNLCYFNESGTGFVSSLTENRSAGPDGVSGNYDDGLPATYDQFFTLCEKLANASITPVAWSGQMLSYVASMMSSLAVDYAGYDDTVARFSYKGEDVEVAKVKEININDREPIFENGVLQTEKVKITEENGYKVFQQPGFYYALTFMQKLINNDRYYDVNMCTGTGFDHLGAQEEYVYSAADPSKRPIAMFVEGSYWYNEAKGAREDCAIDYPTEDGSERRFAFMPLPKANADKLGPQTLIDTNQSAIFINAEIDPVKIAPAKDLLKELYTNEYLSYCARETATLCPFEYEIAPEDYEAMSYFGKSLLDMKANGTRHVFPYSQSKVILANPSFGKPNADWETSKHGTNPVSYFIERKGDENFGAKEYFTSMLVKRRPEVWANSILPQQ